ncbi:MAG: phosphate ABC transporter permease subunit PstC [Bacteroidetes bacterium]|nr:phosphate ABC transporter permease subunit PstC [Bacteroidota bacterium]
MNLRELLNTRFLIKSITQNNKENLKLEKHKNIFLFEKIFQKLLGTSGIILIVILLSIFVTLTISSMPSISQLGSKFIYGKAWDPVTDEYGALPFLIGTLLTSLLALIISMPFSIATALFIGEYYPKGIVSNVFKNIIELLASIPSVIYGFWGIFVLVPIIRDIELKFGVLPYGVGILTSSVILAIMIMPYSVSLSRQVISMVPPHIKEGAYSLGATRFEVIKKIIIPYTRSGLFAGVLLALGRALGETMAVTMLIGNSHDIPKSIFSPGNTMASVIANEFTEATGTIYLSALIEMGLMLFIVTTLINVLGRQIIKRFMIN